MFPLLFSLMALASICECDVIARKTKYRAGDGQFMNGSRDLTKSSSEDDDDTTRGAPNYMLDLYERNKYSAVKKGNDRATTVRMINGEIGKVSKDEPRMFIFNLSTVMSSEKILSAELHIYKKEGDPTVSWRDIEIVIYQINRKFTRYIGHDWLHKKQRRGWQILDITPQVGRCLKNRKREHSLGIQLRDAKSKSDIKLNGFKRKSSRPFLVVYSNETQNLTIDHIDPRFSPRDLVTLENQLKRNGYHQKGRAQKTAGMRVDDFLQADEHVAEEENNVTKNETDRPKDSVAENNKEKALEREKRSVMNNQVPQIGGGETVEAIIVPITGGMKFPKPGQFPFSSTDPSILRERNRQRNTKYVDDNGGHRHRGSSGHKSRKTIPYPRGFHRKQRRMRRKRRRWNRRNRRRFDDSLWNDRLLGGGGVAEATARAPTGVCQRRRLRVNFQDIGWNKWIINPKSFDAYYCAGMCPFQKIKSLSPSNHATIQSIVHAIGINSQIPEPCCVPQSMSSVSLLFFDENENVVLKNYPGMSVERCACQ